jgi:hypothetical protein
MALMPLCWLLQRLGHSLKAQAAQLIQVVFIIILEFFMGFHW